MENPEKTYTYRQGEKLELEKQPDQLVVRTLPDRVPELGQKRVQQVSSQSTRVSVEPDELEGAMERMRRVAPTHHAYRIAESGDEFLITDRVLVTFHEPPDEATLDAFTGEWGLVLRDRLSDRDFLFQLTDHTGMNPVKLVVKLQEEDDRVELAENDVNQRVRPDSPVPVPADPHYNRQWFLHTRYNHTHFDPRSSARCEEAWVTLDGHGDSAVVVGITDDGCRLDHPDLDSPGKFAGWAYMSGTRLVEEGDVDADPLAMYVPGENHGTSCAGVVAGEVDASLTVGAAPGCRLLPVRWQISPDGYLLTSDYKMLKVLNYVADRVDVLSSSWSRTPSSIWALQVVRRIRELAESGGRRGRGILFLWAAGNDNAPLEYDGDVDVPYTDGWLARPDGSWVWIGPATSRRFRNNLVAVDGVAHIAALASTARRSHYSNYGRGIVLCAPTNNIHAYHRASVRGLGVTTATGEPSGVTHGFGGTSSATPLVAGIAALVISADPRLSGKEVLSLLKSTASRDLDPAGYDRTPPASFDQDTSWDVSPVTPYDDPSFRDEEGDADGPWSPWFGWGRVDAAAAVREALRRRAEDRGGAPPDGRRQVRKGARPNLAIPDDDARGVRSILNVGGGGVADGIEVRVQIRHTWIGDLRVLLVGPQGHEVVLHSRTNGSRDLRRSYDVAAVPALHRLIGERVDGDWTLRVEDHAPLDVGVLESWELLLDVAPAPRTMTDAPGVIIPDNDPQGIVRTLDVPAGTTVRDIAVTVDLTHTWFADLRISLAPPGRAAFPLEPIAGTGASMVRTWRSGELPGLTALRGTDPGGEWQLAVVDRLARDVGKLNRWTLEWTTA